MANLGSDDYELMPKKELEELRREVSSLKKGSLTEGTKSGALMDSMDRLTISINRLITILDDAEKDIIEEYQESKPVEKLNKLLDQNETMARVLLSMNDAISPRGNSNTVSMPSSVSPQSVVVPPQMSQPQAVQMSAPPNYSRVQMPVQQQNPQPMYSQPAPAQMPTYPPYSQPQTQSSNYPPYSSSEAPTVTSALPIPMPGQDNYQNKSASQSNVSSSQDTNNSQSIPEGFPLSRQSASSYQMNSAPGMVNMPMDDFPPMGALPPLDAPPPAPKKKFLGIV